MALPQCHCILASGPNAGNQCSNSARYPPSDPLFCGIHKNCKYTIFDQKASSSSRKKEDTKAKESEKSKERQSLSEMESSSQVQQFRRQMQEFAKIRKQIQSKDPTLIEHLDLIQITEQHFEPSPKEDPSTKPIDFTYSNISFTIYPSLQQERKKGESTNYCGYYALYNAICMSNDDFKHMLNRNKFVTEIFVPSLLRIKRSRGNQPPYDNLTSPELQTLSEIYSNVIVVELLNLYWYGQNLYTDLYETFDHNQKTASLFEKFINHEINQLTCLVLITSMKGGNSGHWITVMATRKNDAISLSFADSLHSIQFYIEHKKLIEYRVLPLYWALMGKWEKVVELLKEN